MADEETREGFLVLLTAAAANYAWDTSRAREIAQQVQDEFLGVAVSGEASRAVVHRMKKLAGNPFGRHSYEAGYGDGESNREADYVFALTEYCELPDDVNAWSPQQVAKYIDSLHQRLRDLGEAQ